MIDFDVHEAYVKDRQEVRRCAACGSKDLIWSNGSPDLDFYAANPECGNCGRSWKNDVETFEEWAERKGIDV